MKSLNGGVVRRVVLIATAAMLVGALAGCDPSGFDRAKAAKACGLDAGQIASVGSTKADGVGNPQWIVTDPGGMQYLVTRNAMLVNGTLSDSQYYWSCR